MVSTKSRQSKHVLTLPTEDAAAATALTELARFLELRRYRSLAIVHGVDGLAQDAFTKATERTGKSSKRGVVWLKDAGLVAALDGGDAQDWKTMLAPSAGFLMTFCSLKLRKVVTTLEEDKLNKIELDLAFNKAHLG